MPRGARAQILSLPDLSSHGESLHPLFSKALPVIPVVFDNPSFRWVLGGGGEKALGIKIGGCSDTSEYLQGVFHSFPLWGLPFVAVKPNYGLNSKEEKQSKEENLETNPGYVPPAGEQPVGRWVALL